MQRLIRAFAFCGCLLASGATAGAQTSGRLAGVVRDNTGGVLPAVALTISGAELVAPRTVVSDQRGKYELEKLSRGRYSLAAVLRGFEPWSLDLELDGGSKTVDVVLQVPSFSERVTVSATKTGASDVQSIPLSVTALPARTLEQLQVGTVEDLAGFVPTLTVSHRAGLAQVIIRGIGTNSVVLGADPSSTTHLDGVYLARPAMAFMDFLNVERVEVLRGPQGTLYGRNSVGGTINIVTRQPTNALEASVRLTAGGYDRFRAEGAVSGPLVKNKVMGNFAFVRGTRTGFVNDLDNPEHALGSEDTWAGRAQLRLVFGTRSELLLSGDHQRSEGTPLPEAKPIAAKPGATFANNPSLWDVRASHLATGRNIQQGTSAKLTIQLNSTTTLNSLTAYRRSNYHGFFDADATELMWQTTDVPDIQRQTSQELTLVRHTPRLTWIGGAFLFEEHIEGRVEITLYEPAIQIRPFARVGTNARALFGQATYRLSGRVSLTGGVRYTDEQKDTENTGGRYRIGTDTLANSASFYHYVDTVAFDAWTPKIGIEAQASRETLVYLSAARGFKSGGFNPAAPQPGQAFNPEFAWTYEGGLKRSMAGGRVRANTAVFYSDYRDLQVQSFISSGVPDIRNAAAATIKGVEVEVAAAAWRGVHSGLRLSGHLAWLDATYDRFLAVVPGGSTRPVAGNHLNNAPEWSGSGSVVYDFATGSAGTASVRGDLSWQSRVFFTPVNDAVETQPRYGLVHLRAGFEPPSHRWEFSVYVRNAGNQEYITGTGNVALTAVTARPGEPRMWGTQFTLRR